VSGQSKSASALLAALNLGAEPQPPTSAPTPRVVTPAAAAAPRGKHIGGYFDQDLVEKVALLKVRLKVDNSELIKRAIDELYSREVARRAFGD